MPRDLKKLPSYLKQPITTLAKEVSPEDNKCIGCWRPYNIIEDPSNEAERPCQPLRVQPCNHLVGSQCLSELWDRIMKNCPYCNSDIQQVSTIPFWQMWLLECDVFPFTPVTYLKGERPLADYKGMGYLARRKEQPDSLFKGTLRADKAEEIWSEYMQGGLSHILMVLLPYLLFEFLLLFVLKPLLGLVLPSWFVSSAFFAQGVNLPPVVTFLWMLFFWKSFLYFFEKGESKKTNTSLNFILSVTALLCAIKQMAILVTLKIVVFMFVVEMGLIVFLAGLVVKLGSRNRRS